MGKVLHASKSGYFPFCIAPPSNPALARPLVDAMEWFWRIKSYKVSAPASTVTVQDTDAFDKPTITTSFPAIDSIFVLRPEITSEEEIVCNEGLNNGFVFTYTGTRTIDIPPSTFSVPLLIGHSVAFLGSGENATGNLLQSPKTINLIIPTTMDGAYVISGGATNAICGVLTVKTTKNLVQTFNIIFSQAETTLISGSINVLIEPNEYWSYGGTYNTSTGLPL